MNTDPTPAADAVRSALTDLDRRAGALPTDPPALAAGRVLAVFRADEARGERSDPAGCVLWSWLRLETGLPFACPSDRGSACPRLLLSTGHAIVTEAGEPHRKRMRTVLEFPASVRAAVELLSARPDQNADLVRRVA